jgi:hypothetical protein
LSGSLAVTFNPGDTGFNSMIPLPDELMKIILPAPVASRDSSLADFPGSEPRRVGKANSHQSVAENPAWGGTVHWPVPTGEGAGRHTRGRVCSPFPRPERATRCGRGASTVRGAHAPSRAVFRALAEHTGGVPSINGSASLRHSHLPECASLGSPPSRPNNHEPTNQIERMKNPESNSQTLACPAIHRSLAGRVGRWLLLSLCLMGWAVAPVAFAQAESTPQPEATATVITDKSDYVPGTRHPEHRCRPRALDRDGRSVW